MHKIHIEHVELQQPKKGQKTEKNSIPSIPGPFEASTNVIVVKGIRNTCHYQYLKDTFVHFEYMVT